MSPAVLAAAVLPSLSVGVLLAPPGALARWSLRRHRPDLSRRRGRVDPIRRSGRRALIVAVVETVGRRLRHLAGRPSGAEADRRVGAAVLAALVGAAVISPLVALPVAAAVHGIPTLRVRGRRRARERRVRTVLPDAVDLFRLAVGAGLSVHQAIEAVAAHAPEPVAGALGEVGRRVELGDRLGDALDVLDELGDPALSLAAALRGAARYGSPLAAALERAAIDARVLRRRRAEEDARRLPIQLLFPLVVCVLPAFGLLAVVPLLLSSLRSLQL